MPSRPSVPTGSVKPSRRAFLPGAVTQTAYADPSLLGGTSCASSANSSCLSWMKRAIVPLALPPLGERSAIVSAACGVAVAAGVAEAAGVAVGGARGLLAAGVVAAAEHEEQHHGDDGEDARDQQRPADPRRGGSGVVARGRRSGLADRARARAGHGGRGGGQAGRGRGASGRRPGSAGSPCGATSCRRADTSVAQARAGADSASSPRVASASAGAQLAEQVVGERAGDLVRQPVVARQRGEAGVCAGADAVDRHPQQGRDLVVGAPLLEHQRDDGALVGGERLEWAHRPPIKVPACE